MDITRSKYAVLMLLMSLITMMSCESNDPFVQGKTNDELLQDYFTANNITPEKTASGMYYVIDVPGSEEKPISTSSVTVFYKGYFLDGEEFDSTGDSPISFSLQAVIAGWTEGIQLYGRGGSGTLFIPSQLAYGRAGRGSIPPDTPLIFDVEIVDFQ